MYTLKYMIEKDLISDVNQMDNFGNTPLMTAIEHDSIDCVKLLIQHKDVVRLPSRPNHNYNVNFAMSSPDIAINYNDLGPHMRMHGDKNNTSNSKLLPKEDMCCLEYCASVGSDECLHWMLYTLFTQAGVNC